MVGRWRSGLASARSRRPPSTRSASNRNLRVDISERFRPRRGCCRTGAGRQSRAILRDARTPWSRDGSEQRKRFSADLAFCGSSGRAVMVEAARFAEGESIAVLADTRRLWVAAQIHQRDWNSLKVAAGETLTVRIRPSPIGTFPRKSALLAPPSPHHACPSAGRGAGQFRAAVSSRHVCLGRGTGGRTTEGFCGSGFRGPTPGGSRFRLCRRSTPYFRWVEISQGLRHRPGSKSRRACRRETGCHSGCVSLKSELLLEHEAE